MIFRTLLNSGCIAAIALGYSGMAIAQAPSSNEGASGSSSDGKLEEIVVTARKVSENLQKAPASIVAIQGEALVKAGVTNPLQLQKVLPSASLHEEGAVTQTFIRGIGSRSDFPWLSTAAIFLFNDIIIPRYGTTGMIFDLENVQSIAGPQGTLYGGSAAGGAINLNGAMPENNYDGSGTLELGTYGTVNAAMAQNIPLGDDVSFRGAIDYRRHDGYFNRGIDAQNRISGRASLKMEVTENLTASIFFNGARETGRPRPATAVNVSGGNPWNLPAFGPLGNRVDARDTFQDNQTYVLGAHISWKAGDTTFTYIPGYVNINDDYASYVALYKLLDVRDKENQVSHELRWSAEVGNIKVNLGAFYLRNSVNFGYGIAIPTAVTPTSYFHIPLNVTDQINKSYAFYGQAVYSVLDTLRFTGGIRYSNDKIVGSGIGGSGAFAFNNSEGRIDWKAGVDFDIAPRVMVYANVQSGYIPFGYNPDVLPSETVPTSKLKSYSAGIKSRLLGNHLEVNDEIFYYDYRKFQAIDFVNATNRSTVLNADKGTIYGNDLGVRALFSENTEASINLVLLHTRFDSFQGVGYNFTGNKFVNAPSVNLIAGLQHKVQLGEGSLLGRVSTHYESGHYAEFTNVPETRQRRYTTTDLSITYTPDSDRWSVQAYVNNIEKSVVFGTIAYVSPNDGEGPLSPPRTFGVRLSGKW